MRPRRSLFNRTLNWGALVLVFVIAPIAVFHAFEATVTILPQFLKDYAVGLFLWLASIATAITIVAAVRAVIQHNRN